MASSAPEGAGFSDFCRAVVQGATRLRWSWAALLVTAQDIREAPSEGSFPESANPKLSSNERMVGTTIVLIFTLAFSMLLVEQLFFYPSSNKASATPPAPATASRAAASTSPPAAASAAASPESAPAISSAQSDTSEFEVIDHPPREADG